MPVTVNVTDMMKRKVWFMLRCVEPVRCSEVYVGEKSMNFIETVFKKMVNYNNGSSC